LQNPRQINGDNVQNLRRETSRTFRKKKREYLKDKINGNKNKKVRDLYSSINEYKKGYQPRIKIINDENGNLLTDPQSVLNKWESFFKQVLNVHGVHDIRQMDIYMASLVKVEIAIGKLKRFQPNQSKQEAQHYVLRYTNLFVLYGIRRNCYSSRRKLLFY
jgi:hypothetical protein